jgi:O-succinylbenzoate synthase
VLVRRVELRVVRIPLVAPFETSGWVEENKTCIIVALEGDGVVGYGECVAQETPSYSYETVETAWHVMSDFILPAIVGREFQEVGEFVEAASKARGFQIRGHNMAKAAVEMAFWDAYSKARGISLSRALGGVKSEVPVGVSLGLQRTPEELIRLIGRYLDEGYRRIKVKIKPGMDVELVGRVRDAYPSIPLMVDANGAYTLRDKERLKALDRYDLMMIEQPLAFDDLVDHARLQRMLKTPLCLDESIHGVEDARKALMLKSCRVINIKPGRVGGHQQSKRIHDFCMRRGIPVWCGGMLETGVGRAHNVALASLPNFTLPGDTSASRRYFQEDIVEPPFELNRDGTLSVPRGPGIGVEVVQERLDKYTVRRRVFPG